MLELQSNHIVLTVLIGVIFLFSKCYINYLTFDVESDFPLNVKFPLFSQLKQSQLFDRLGKNCPYYKNYVDDHAKTTKDLIDWNELCWRQSRLLGKIALPYDPKILDDQQLCTAIKYRCKNVVECPRISTVKKNAMLEKCLFDFIPIYSLTGDEVEIKKHQIFKTDSINLVVTIYSCTPNPFLYKMWQSHGEGVRFMIICPLHNENVFKPYPLADFTWPNGAKLEIGQTIVFYERALSREHLKVAEKIETVLDSQNYLFVTSLFIIFAIPLLTYGLMIAFLLLMAWGEIIAVPKYGAWIVFILTVLLTCSYARCQGSVMSLLPFDFLIWIYKNPVYNLLTYQCWASVLLFVGLFDLRCMAAILDFAFKIGTQQQQNHSSSSRSEHRQEPNNFRSQTNSNGSTHHSNFNRQSDSNSNGSGSSNFRSRRNSNEFNRSRSDPPPQNQRRRPVRANQIDLTRALEILNEYVEETTFHLLIQELPVRIVPRHKTPDAISEVTNMRVERVEDKKTAMKKLIALYHPDHIDQSTYGRKYYVMCEEITKELNIKNRSL